MAACRRRKNGTYEFIIRRKHLLPRPKYFTFDSKAEGEAYCARLEALLDAGIMPPELLDVKPNQALDKAIRDYLDVTPITKDDRAKLVNLSIQFHGTALASLDFLWAQAWVSSMKREKKLAPGTINKYVGALSRCLDWHLASGSLTLNPLRLLPRNYSRYTAEDERVAGVKRENQSRDTRLGDRGDLVLEIIETDPRLLGDRAALRLLFIMALESAMRLREMFTLDWGQVDTAARTIYLEKTKNGSKRQVPITSVLLRHLVPSSGLVFPWWNGDPKSVEQVTSKLSRQFARIFEWAGMPELRFHDLRHEATSRLYEKTNLSDLEVMKITGHSSLKMLARYANLRGSNLAARLW
jgi:integrase